MSILTSVVTLQQQRALFGCCLDNSFRQVRTTQRRWHGALPKFPAVIMWQKYMPRPYRHVVAWNEEEEQFQERLRRPPVCQTPLSQVLKARLRELLSRMPKHRGLALRLVELQQQQPPGLNDPWFSKTAAAHGPLDLHSLRVVHASGSATSLQDVDKPQTTTDGTDAEPTVAGNSQEAEGQEQKTPEQKTPEQAGTSQQAADEQPDASSPRAYAASERSSVTALPCFTQTLAELTRYSTLKELTVDEQLHRSYRQEQELQMLAWEVSRWQGGQGRKSRRSPLSVDQLRQLVPALTLNDCQITKVDRGLRRLSRLQLLSLAGNWLHRLPGRRLPSALRSLELFANRLQDLSSLADDPPSWLLHLGLARNQLCDASNLHLLGDCFKQLRTLDLGDNDICVLHDVLNTLRDLKHLRSLRLEGNPCAMCVVYREAVLLNAPTLQFLDDVELWNMDRYVPEDVEVRHHLCKGVLLFFCYRLMGLPQPRPMVVSGKKVIQTYHVEVELPLMDPELWKDVPTPPPTPPPERPPSPPPLKGAKSSKKGKKSSRSDDEAVVADGEEALPRPPDPLDGVEEEPVVCTSAWFRTPDLPWAKLLAYPQPLELRAPGEDLSTLRDTFRSEVRVKVVLQQALPPEKPKRAKGGKKDAPQEPPEQPRQTVVGRVVMAQFRLRLRPPRWDETAVDFEWQLPESGDRPEYAQPATEPLLDIVYRDKKEKSKPGARGAASEPLVEPRPVPERLTCHVGLGVGHLLPVRPHVSGYEAESLGLSSTWSIL